MHVIACYKDVIYIHQKCYERLIEFLGEKRVIRPWLFESTFENSGWKFWISLPWSLFKTIQGFVKLAYNILPLAVKSLRLLHVNLLMKFSMKESIVYIKLNQVPTPHNRYGKQGFNSGHFSNRWKDVYEVQTLLLCKTLSHKACLIPLHSTISLILHSIYPFAPNSPFMRW